VARALALDPQGRRLRCWLDRSHWASVWLRRNRVKCFVCRTKPLTTIDLVAALLDLTLREALEWLAKRFDMPRRRLMRIDRGVLGTSRPLPLIVKCRTPKRLVPDVSTLRRAPGWPFLSHAARLLALVIIERIPWHTPTMVTTQEQLRGFAGIADRRTAKKALAQLETIGLVATQRVASERNPLNGQFTTELCINLEWGSEKFQDWLKHPRSRATKYRCVELHTVETANRHEIAHGEEVANRQEITHGGSIQNQEVTLPTFVLDNPVVRALSAVERAEEDFMVRMFLEKFKGFIVGMQDLRRGGGEAIYAPRERVQ
jgi:hypothetical protein